MSLPGARRIWPSSNAPIKRRQPRTNGSRKCCNVKRSSFRGNWSNNWLEMASKGARADLAIRALPANPADKPAAAQAAHLPARTVPLSRRTKPPRAANKRPNRRSTACARLTKTCGAPSRRMPAQRIPGVRPTACAKLPTCWDGSSSRTPPAASLQWPRPPDNWR